MTDGQQQHDKAMAADFLTGFDPNAKKFAFQFISDGPDRKVYPQIHASLEEAWLAIQDLNTPAHGVGVFVIVKGFSALFVSANDNEQISRSMATIQACGAIPNMTIQSGQNLRFCYICPDMPPDQRATLQKRLSARLGTDPVVANLSRVRLPGTFNLEDPAIPQLVKLVRNGAGGWKLDDLFDKLESVAVPEDSRLAARLGYAARGWDSFPAPPGEKKSYKSAKHSGGAKWGKTRDPEQIRRDLQRWPKANIGIATGADSGIWVFETDTPKGHDVDGDASLQALEEKHGPLPQTLMAESPSGSRHRYFNWPKGVVIKTSASGIAPGIDVRGEGGMVIAPPSVRGDGVYRWLNDHPIADAPQWLIDLAGTKGADLYEGIERMSAAELDDEFSAGLSPELPPLPLEPLMKECAFIRTAIETGGKDYSQSMWNLTTLCAVFLDNGHELAHRMGNKHPDYTKESTDELWARKNREHQEKGIGWPSCKAIQKDGSKHCATCPHFSKAQSPLNLALGADAGVKLEDFQAYLPDHSYIFKPTGTFWSAAGVNACFRMKKANVWLDKNQPAHHLSWAPGHPTLIENQLVVDGGWIERNGVTTFNLYRPPTLKLGDPSKAELWLKLVHKVYPNDAERLIMKLAHRVQRPQEKINHAVVLGGTPGIGKDTILEPVKRAVGPWNFKETSPQQILGRFNGYLQSVIMRISEVRDLGDFNRYQFYEHTKVFFAAPPDVLRVDEKNIPEHDVMNCTFAILTTNRLTDGIYLPADDRRHDVFWSELTKDNFTEDDWKKIWSWYNASGDSHVAAYLATLDISAFDPKAPPHKTAAFWAIVDANRAPEEGELQDLLDKLGNPDAVTLQQLIEKAGGVVTGPYEDKGGIANWLADRKNRRVIPFRLEAAGYVPVRNEARRTGLWVVAGVRQVVYAKKTLSPREQFEAVTTLQQKAEERPGAEEGTVASAWPDL